MCWDSQLARVQWGIQKGIKSDLCDKWSGCWCQTTWSECFTNRLIYWDFHNIISRVYSYCPQEEKTSSEQQLCGGKCCVDVRSGWADWVETIARQEELITRQLQPRSAEKYPACKRWCLDQFIRYLLQARNMHLINEAVSVCLAMNQSGNPGFRPIRK